MTAMEFIFTYEFIVLCDIVNEAMQYNEEDKIDPHAVRDEIRRTYKE